MRTAARLTGVLAVLLAAPACAHAGPPETGPRLEATLQTRLDRAPDALTWTYTLRNDNAVPIVVFDGDSSVTTHDDGYAVQVALRVFAPPDKAVPAPGARQAGRELAPGATLRGTSTRQLPLRVDHPHAGAFTTGRAALPADPEHLVFCIGIAPADVVTASQSPGPSGQVHYQHDAGTAGEQRLVCTETAPIRG